MQFCGSAVLVLKDCKTINICFKINEQNIFSHVYILNQKHKSMTRRDLIGKVLIGGTTLLVIPSVLSGCSKEEDPGGDGGTGGDVITLDLNNPAYSVLNTAGGSVIVKSIIVAYTGTSYVAIDSICTHQGCTIGYSLSDNNFPCPCHGSIYSLTGSIVNGPTTVALKSYPVSKSGSILTISL
jgi:cytochrome b6-f complex iron-sulfur subunit